MNFDRHGFGSALLPNGDIYEGQYYRNMRHGRGVYAFKNGARYDGEWRKGLKHGQGIFYYPDGSKYEGDWWKDKRQGYGTYCYQNGDTFEGAWFKNERHGLGAYTYAASGVKFLGTWIDGKMIGPGHVVYSGYCYHGRWERNLPIGRGVFSFDLKVLLHGYYINMKDPKFDYIGAEEVQLPGQEEAAGDPLANKGAPRGIVPLWRARYVTEYKPEFMPEEPTPIPICYSELSLLDILEYLEKQYGRPAYMGEEEEEEGDEDLGYKYRRMAALTRSPSQQEARPNPDAPPEGAPR